MTDSKEVKVDKKYKGLKTGTLVAYVALAAVLVPYIYYATVLNLYG